MANFLHPKNWSRLLDSNSGHSGYLDQSRNVLFSQFCIIAILGAFTQSTYDFIDGYPLVALIDLSIAVVLIIGYFLNENGKHIFSKILVFFSANVMLFSFAAVVPKGVGMYLLFYPLVAFSFIAIDYKHRKYSYLLVLFSLVLNTILVVTNYQPYGNINLQPSDPTISFALNLIISIILLSLGIDFLLRISNTGEQLLIENQKQTEKLAREINEKNLTLEKTNEELDRFVYSTSHDLRSPLASILGLISLTELEEESIPDNIVEYLAMMKERVNSLDHFIQEIIDYSRNARTDITLSEVDIKGLVEEVILNNRFLEKADKVNITTEININTLLTIDYSRISRILNNLVSNAIKYNDLKKPSPFVKITATIKNSSLKIEVIDNGMGIRKDIHNKIFTMFYRGTDSSSGSGLGLYIAREMAQRLNGNLTFTSEPGSGTTFTLVVPLNKEA